MAGNHQETRAGSGQAGSLSFCTISRQKISKKGRDGMRGLMNILDKSSITRCDLNSESNKHTSLWARKATETSGFEPRNPENSGYKYNRNQVAKKKHKNNSLNKKLNPVSVPRPLKRRKFPLAATNPWGDRPEWNPAAQNETSGGKKSWARD